MTGSTVSFVLQNPAGNQVTATTTYNATTQTATLTPASALAGSTSYTATVSGAADAAGNVMDPTSWTFTTAAVDTTKPTVTGRTPASGATGVATGVAPTATFSEPVTGSTVSMVLRNPAGNEVTATTTFNATTQTATLTPASTLQPGTTYTAEVSGATDVSGNVMDPVSWTFTTAADTTKPTVTGRTPASGASGVAAGVAPTATFSEPVTGSTVSFLLRNPAGNQVTATTTFNATNQTATLTPASALQPGVTYTAEVSGATDASGNVMDLTSWTFTTAALDTTKPTLTGRTPASGAASVATSVAPNATFNEPVTGSTVSFVLRNPAGTQVTATTTYNAATQTATLTPASALATSTAYTATVSGATDAAGNVMDSTSWTFTTAASASSCPCTIWPTTAAPAATDPDTSSVELGVKFRTSRPATSPASGTTSRPRPAAPTSAASGRAPGPSWRRSPSPARAPAAGSRPPSRARSRSQPNTTYVASYFTPSRYAVSGGYFATATTRGPLTALSNGTDGGNGLYRYTSTAGVFPTSSYNSENYWVDVVFQENAEDTDRPRRRGPDACARRHRSPDERAGDRDLQRVPQGRDHRGGPQPGGQADRRVHRVDTGGPRVRPFHPQGPPGVDDVLPCRSAARTTPPATSRRSRWSFPTAAAATPAPDQGPGGPARW